MSAVTLAKIEKLLDDGLIIPGNNDDHDENTTTRSLLQDERILTALVLYTRLDPTAGTTTIVDDIENFWRSHGAVLVPWIQNLIQPSSPSDDDDDVDVDIDDGYHDTAGQTATTTSRSSNYRRQFHRLYIRLVAQVLISVTTTNKTISDHIKQTVTEPLGTALMKVWNARHVLNRKDNAADDDKISSARMLDDLDLLAGLAAWLATRVGDKEKWTQNDVVFRQIVERLKQTEPPKDSTTKGASQQSTKPATSPEALMIQTLSALLDQNSPFPQSEKPCSWADCVEQTGLSLLFCQHCQHVPESSSSVPSFFQCLLDWWVSQQSSSRRCSSAIRDRSVWAQVLLLSTLELAKKNRKLLQQSELSSLTKVLLACVVSISTTATTTTTTSSTSTSTCAPSEELRTLAWTTGASLIDVYGWEFWLAHSSSRSSSSHNKKHPLGHASQLCVWLRLAAGEWKIQLGWFLTDTKNDMSDDDNNVDSSSLASDRIRIVQACAHMLVQGLQYMTQMADRMDYDDDDEDDQDNNLPKLSADAILHIQKSLLETLHSAVQYLGESRLSLQQSPDINAVTDLVVFVLGNLLSEMDAFASIPSSKDALGENEILQALVSALKYDSSITAQEHLLPGLTAVFASSEGDKARIQLLKEYGLTGASLEEYFAMYFRRTNNLESLMWACQLVDLWTSIVSVDVGSSLLDSILSCLQRLLSMSGGGKELGTALSSAVACYVTLKDDEPPNDRDSQIIQQAMEMSSRLIG